jgi:hypothetical protein
MARKFLTPIGAPSLSQDPSSGVIGSIYYNNDQGLLKFYDGTAWVQIVSGGSGYTNEQAVDAVAQAISNGTHTNVQITYDDPNNSISFNVDNKVELVTSYANTPTNGSIVYNTNRDRFAIAYNNIWKELAYKSEFDSPVDGGSSSTSYFDLVLDGGESSDNTFVNQYYQ